MGALVSEVVREIECSIPQYQEEIFIGELCEFPKADDLRFLVAHHEFHRDLAVSYTYNGSGRCRRCRTTARRSLGDLQAMTKEMACSHAANANLGVKIAGNSMSEAYDSYEEIMDLAAAFYDAKKGAKMVEDAEKQMKEVEEHEKVTKAEAKVCEELCEMAMDSRTSSKQLEDIVKSAEKSNKKAMDEALKVSVTLHKLRDVKIDFLVEEVKYEAKVKKGKVMNVIEKMASEIEKRIEKLKEAIEKLKSLAKTAKDKGDKEKEKKYNREIQILEEEKTRLEDESKESAKFLMESQKIDEKIEILRVELINPEDEEDWLRMFSGLLSMDIPKKLMYYYNTTTGGCLDVQNVPEAKVECWPVPEIEQTVPLEDCELNFILD